MHKCDSCGKDSTFSIDGSEFGYDRICKDCMVNFELSVVGASFDRERMSRSIDQDKFSKQVGITSEAKREFIIKMGKDNNE